MPEAYDLHEGRFLNEKNTGSAADALFLVSEGPPAGKVWTILFADYKPTAAETRTVGWHLYSTSGLSYAISVPLAVALDSTHGYPLLTEGNEVKLYPQQKLKITRDVATAGSSMIIYFLYIESDLPYYAYSEPLNRVVQTKKAHGSVFRRGGGLSTGSSIEASSPVGERGARGGGSEPI